MDLKQEQIKYQTTNDAYIEPNILQLRLDTRDLLDNIKSFLKGGRIVYQQDATGRIDAKFISEGSALANDMGVQSVVSWISMQLNPSTVQGNISFNQYLSFLERTRKRLAKNLLINSPRYDIERQDRAFIIDAIMNMLELFISRCLDNKERESYVKGSSASIGNLLAKEKKGILS